MMRTFLSVIIACAVALTAFAGKSGQFADVSHEELKAAIASGQATIIDVNGSRRYAQGHIPGAVDYSAVKDQFAAVLPADKDALIIAYCGGPTCGAYKQAAEAAVALGYRNVKHYSGGISGWEQKGEKTMKKS